MPLGDNSQKLHSGVVTPLRPDTSRHRATATPNDSRLDNLETRLQRLESGHITALNLVRRALSTLKNTQSAQNAAQHHAISRLAAQLGECEAALTRLDEAHRRDDETMRERLFDMGETLDVVRAAASAAVRPAALRKLERALTGEMDERGQSLRAELDEKITERVDAAEGRSADALDTLEENFWDDMTEIARRFDSLADTVGEMRRDAEHPSHDASAAAPARTRETAGAATDGRDCVVPHSDEDIFHLTEEMKQPDEALLVDGTPADGVIAFPARQPNPEMAEAPRDIGAALTAAALRAGGTDADPEESATRWRQFGPAFNPLRRLVTSAGSAAMAVCIMAGLSLLAGPALGPGLQGAAPAFAHDWAEWTPVEVAPQAIALTPRLKPILHPAEISHSVRKVHAATSDR